MHVWLLAAAAAPAGGRGALTEKTAALNVTAGVGEGGDPTSRT